MLFNVPTIAVAQQATGTFPQDDLAPQSLLFADAVATPVITSETEGRDAAVELAIEYSEIRFSDVGESYFGEISAEFGGSRNRFGAELSGEVDLGGDALAIEAQVRYLRSLTGEAWLILGARHDILPDPSRSYAVAGLAWEPVPGLTIEASTFLSDQAELSGRVEAAVDIEIASRLALQPKAEVNWSAQSELAEATGAGFTDAEAALRLGYQLLPSVAPYMGIVYRRALGKTADYLNIVGEDVEEASLAVGLSVIF